MRSVILVAKLNRNFSCLLSHRNNTRNQVDSLPDFQTLCHSTTLQSFGGCPLRGYIYTFPSISLYTKKY